MLQTSLLKISIYCDITNDWNKLIYSRNKLCGLKQRINDDDDIKQQRKQIQNVISSDSREQLESNAPNNLILVSIPFHLGKNSIDFTFPDEKKVQLVLIRQF